MICPRCTTPLLDVTPDLELPHVKGQGCAQCHGHWVETTGLHELESTVRVTWVELRHVPSAEQQQTPLSCPRCVPVRGLEKKQSSRDDYVVMDVCSSCGGVWLDGGELAAIQEKGALASLVDAIRFVVR